MMNNRAALVVATILVVFAPPGWGVTAESAIDRVTIYPQRLARVERIARVDIASGEGQVSFADLPQAIETGSVRVAVESGELQIGSIEVAREPVGGPARAREQELQDQIDQLQTRRQTALDHVAAAQAQITFIEGLAQLPRGKDAAAALTSGEGASRWADLWERIGEGSRQAHARMRTSEREAAELKTRINTLEQRREQLGAAREQVVRVTVPYADARAGKTTLRLTYRVRGPRWQPLYETRLDTASGQLHLVRSARVDQATGEDWSDVHLRLSTARPVRGERPQPNPWWIDLAPEIKPLARESEAAQSLKQQPSAYADPEAAGARTVNAEFAATYVIPGRVSVPAGNQPRELRIGSRTLHTEVGATVFPQRDPRAWLTASTTWEGEGPLPAGRVARFRDGAYVGSGRLAQWSPGQERDLSFGIDPRLEVSFEPTRDEAGESGWISTQSTRARSYNLRLVNRHERALPITALFRVPVARNKAIDVTERFPTPPDERDIDDRKGVHTWTFDLAPGKTRTLELGYKVTWPEERDLSGL